MLKYILGLIKNLFNPAVHLFTQIDNLSEIDRRANIFSFSKVFNSKIGKYTYVGRKASVVYAEIGCFCSIAPQSIIGMGEHTITYMSTSPIFTERNNGTGKSWTNKNMFPYKKVFVGNDVWIGEGAMIMGGKKIGDGAVIGAGAIVTKDVPPYAIVGGVPAKIIRFRFPPDVVEKLLDLKWWNLSEDVLKGCIECFQNDNLKVQDIEEMIIKKEAILNKDVRVL